MTSLSAIRKTGGALRSSSGVGYSVSSDETCDAVSGVAPGDANGDGIVGPTEVVRRLSTANATTSPAQAASTEVFLASLHSTDASSGLFGVLSYGAEGRQHRWVRQCHQLVWQARLAEELHWHG